MQIIDVYINKIKAGELCSDENNKLSFQYSEQWIKLSSIPLSALFPITDKVYMDKEIRTYLLNMLPEELIIQQLAHEFKIDANNVFEILKIIGLDCGGTISFWPQGEYKKSQAEYVPLSDEEWNNWLNDKTPYPLLNNPDQDIRLSLAGAQIKTVLFFDKDKSAYQVKSGAISSHIIKPPHRWVASDLVRNELVCLKLASSLGIKAADAEIWRNCLKVKRFDRVNIEGKLARLHQEDFCQLLSRRPENKYESLSIPENLHPLCFQTLDELGKKGLLKSPAKSKMALLDLIIYNVLIWNTDAHLKNYSVLYDGSGKCELSPAYDLICTRKLYQKNVHGKKQNLGSKLAISIGGEKVISQIKRKNWVKFASDCNISQFLLYKKIKRLTDQIYDRAKWTLRATTSEYGHSEFDDLFLKTIKQQRDRAYSWLE